MNFPDEGKDQGKGVTLCLACETFGIRPAQPAVDPTLSSTDEADRLCFIHRERVLRGTCFLCGVAEMWASCFSDQSIGCCHDCIRKYQGPDAAREVEAELKRRREEKREGDGDSPTSSLN